MHLHYRGQQQHIKLWPDKKEEEKKFNLYDGESTQLENIEVTTTKRDVKEKE